MRRRWLVGLTVGATAGAGVLLAGAIGGLLGIVAILLAIAEPPRGIAIAGVLVGLAGAWIVLFARIAAGCREGCVGPDLTPWLVVAGSLLGIGLLVSWHLTGTVRSSWSDR